MEGRQEGNGGWHSIGDAHGIQEPWPQSRSVTCPPSTHFWGQLSLGAGMRMLISPGGAMEVQHRWCSVLHHPPCNGCPGWILAPALCRDPRVLLFPWWLPCKRGSGGWGGRPGKTECFSQAQDGSSATSSQETPTSPKKPGCALRGCKAPGGTARHRVSQPWGHGGPLSGGHSWPAQGARFGHGASPAFLEGGL